MKTQLKRLLIKYTYIMVVITLLIPPTFAGASETIPAIQYDENKTVVDIVQSDTTEYPTVCFESNTIIGEMEKKRLAKIEEDKRKEIERKDLEEKKKIQDNYDKECYYDLDDLSKPSHISVQRAYELLAGTTYQTWDMAQTFVNAEKLETPVNAVFSIALSRHESFHGKSELARDKNNISSWRNNDGSWRSFDSKQQCIDKTDNMLSVEYLNPKGDFFNGKSIKDVGKDYCEGNTWSGLVNDMMKYITNKY